MNLIKRLIAKLTGKKSSKKRASAPLKKRGAESKKRSSAFGRSDSARADAAFRSTRRSAKRGGRGKSVRGEKEALPVVDAGQAIGKRAKKTYPIAELSLQLPDFVSLGLSSKTLSAVRDMGYTSPTPIQKEAVPVVLSGRDVIGTAQTGTGKTAAFLLPLIDLLGKCSNIPRVLVLSPTRELASQTAEAFEKFSEYSDLKCVLIQGGVSMKPQVDALSRGVDVLVATPGRLLDLMRQRVVNLKSIKYLVLDEVDRMFDMGFIDDVSDIIRHCPKERQTLFFSATMPDAVLRLSEWALSNPVRLEAGTAHSPADTIEHFIYPVDGIQKYDMLVEILKRLTFDSLIVFTRTRIDADRIGEWLLAHDYKVSILHSDRTQHEREKALADFKEGKTNILVATDIASRGLDISNVGYVINYNVPEHSEDYVHRIGRTGRANREGTAVTLYSSEETEFLRRIESFINARIERRKLEGFPYRNEPVLDSPPKKRRRRNM